jgi:hypothetical protein
MTLQRRFALARGYACLASAVTEDDPSGNVMSLWSQIYFAHKSSKNTKYPKRRQFAPNREIFFSTMAAHQLCEVKNERAAISNSSSQPSTELHLTPHGRPYARRHSVRGVPLGPAASDVTRLGV